MTPTFVQDPKNGCLRVWKFPELRRSYILAADVAEGLEKGDYTAAHVIDVGSFEQAAVWWGKEDPYQFARMLYGLGIWYNGCLIACERNENGIVVINYLRANSYPQIYKMEKFEYEMVEETDKLGWITTARSRPLLIDALRESVRTQALILNDSETLAEMRTFIRNPRTGKIEAAVGSNDDLVISLGIACHLRMKMAAGLTYRPDTGYMDRARARERGGVVMPGRGGY